LRFGTGSFPGTPAPTENLSGGLCTTHMYRRKFNLVGIVAFFACLGGTAKTKPTGAPQKKKKKPTRGPGAHFFPAAGGTVPGRGGDSPGDQPTPLGDPLGPLWGGGGGGRGAFRRGGLSLFAGNNPSVEGGGRPGPKGQHPGHRHKHGPRKGKGEGSGGGVGGAASPAVFGATRPGGERGAPRGPPTFSFFFRPTGGPRGICFSPLGGETHDMPGPGPRGFLFSCWLGGGGTGCGGGDPTGTGGLRRLSGGCVFRDGLDKLGPTVGFLFVFKNGGEGEKGWGVKVGAI